MRPNVCIRNWLINSFFFLMKSLTLLPPEDSMAESGAKLATMEAHFTTMPFLNDVGKYQDLVDTLMLKTRPVTVFTQQLLSARVPIQKLEMFQYFKVFDCNVWICTLISMLLLGFLQSIINGSMRKTFHETFQYLMSLMSEMMTKLYKNNSIRWLNGVWFLFCATFLSAFAGCMFNIMTKGTEYMYIDHLSDLLKPEWKHLQILAVENTPPHSYLDKPNAEDETGQKLHKQLHTLSIDTIISAEDKVTENILRPIRNKTAALFLDLHISSYYINRKMKEETNFHVAKDVSWPVGAYLWVNRDVENVDAILSLYNYV